MGGSGQARLVQHEAEELPILGRVNGLRTRPQDRHSGVLEPSGQRQRSLPAELDDHPGHRTSCPLRLIDLHDVLIGERLEVEAVGDVVVGGNGLGIAVDHDGLVAIGERYGGVHAGVVEFDALADAIGAAAQDDDGLAPARNDLGLQIVGGVVVRSAGRELRSAGINGLVDRTQAIGVANFADRVLADAPQSG